MVELADNTKKEFLPIFIKGCALNFVDMKISLTAELKSVSQIMGKRVTIGCECTLCGHVSNFKFKKCKSCYGTAPKDHFEDINILKGNISEDEPTDNLKSYTLNVEFRGDLIHMQQILQVGNKYCFNGILRKELKKDILMFYLECSSIEIVNTGLKAIDIAASDKEKCYALANDSEFPRHLMRAVFGNSLYGLDIVQESILLQMVSSPKLFEKGVLADRGRIMILLVGSPGKGKSVLLKKTKSFYPLSRYATGSGSSGIGLTASVRKDDFVGDYVLEPGAVALCNGGGIAAIDEIDKISKEDLTKLNTMMDSLTIPIDKASIHRTLKADASILGAMNPKHGTIDPSADFMSQLNLKKDFIDRFDIVWNIDHFSKPDQFEKALEKSSTKHVVYGSDGLIPTEMARKYIILAQDIFPKVSQSAMDDSISAFKSILGSRSGQTENYYSLRLFDTFMRIVKAYARVRLSNFVDKLDIENASTMLKESFKSIGVFKEAEGLNQYVMEEVSPTGIRQKCKLVFEIIKSLGGKDHPIYITEITDKYSADDLDDILEKMYKYGDIVRPRAGQVKLQ